MTSRSFVDRLKHPWKNECRRSRVSKTVIVRLSEGDEHNEQKRTNHQ